jgi:hypothetical protein
MHFEIQGKIEDIETVAIGNRVRDLARLKKQFGSGRWRKLKGTARVKLANGHIRRAEVHWYEAPWDRETEDENQAIYRLRLQP